MRENNLLGIFLKLPIIITLPIISCLIITKANAQITPDNTLGNENSMVTPGNVNGLPRDIITGGATRGGNLFHSFQDFNVLEGRGAFFENPAGIFNILNRVTGNNISEILGTLGVLGDANLFFINPNGIIFGENASLNVNGSVVFSTADSVVFDNGFEFSASNPQAPPLLTINIPIGLGLRDNLGTLDTSSINQESQTLLVNSSDITIGDSTIQNSSLLNGDIFISNQVLESVSGDTNLFLQASDNILIDNLNYVAPSQDVSLVSGENISLENSFINVIGNGSGSVEVKASGNIDIQSSSIIGGIGSGNTGLEAMGENISFNATGGINIDNSAIGNQVGSNAVGNAGNTLINAASLIIVNGGFISNNIFGEGDSGNIIIDVTDSILIDGETSQGITGFSFISSQVTGVGEGNSGGIQLTSGSLSLTNGGIITSGVSGKGNSGIIVINTRESVIIDGENSAGFFSNIASQVNPTGQGNSGGIQLTSESLSLTNGVIITSSVSGVGNSGRITIEITDSVVIDGEDSLGFTSNIITQVNSGGEGNSGGIELTSESLSLTNGGIITSSVSEEGNSGSITIDVTDSIVIDGEATNGNASNINSVIFPNGVGNSGGIELSSGSLSLTNGGNINTSTFDVGNLGSIIIDVTGSVVIDGENSQENSSSIISQVGDGSMGDSGGIELSSGNLSLTNGGFIDTSILGEGNSGSIIIDVTGSVVIDGEDFIAQPSGISFQVVEDGKGNSGGLELRSDSLSLTNGGFIEGSILGEGNTGNIIIDVRDSVVIDGETSQGESSGIFVQINSTGQGNSGGIQLSSSNLSLTNGATINNNIFGVGNSDNIIIDVRDSVVIDGEDSGGGNSSIQSAIGEEGRGNSGGIQLNSNSLTITNGGNINTSTLGEGEGGSILIDVVDFIIIDGEDSQGEGDNSIINGFIGENGRGSSGGVEINSGNLTLTNGAAINTSTLGIGDSGSIVINVTDSIVIDGEDSQGFNSNISTGVGFEAIGNSSGLEINSSNLSLTNGGIINASTGGQGDSGNIIINVEDSIVIDGEDSEGFGSNISTGIGEDGAGNSGRLEINGENLILTNGGSITTSTFGQGNSGEIIIDVYDAIIIDGVTSEGLGSNINSAVDIESVGNSGGIQLTSRLFNLTNQGTIILSTLGEGNSGSIIIDVSDSITIDNGFILTEVEPNALGNAEDITILTPNLVLSNNSIISTTTLGNGNAGDITITESETIILENGSAITTEIANGGISDEPSNINITSSNLTLNDNSQITASTFGDGDGGNIDINLINDANLDNSFITVQAQSDDAGGDITLTANNLNLNNNSLITTGTVSGDGGNIIINTNSLLNLSNNSPLVTEAGITGGPGDGGDITINTEFFRASEDSDITANANEGNGGNISITAFGIFLDNDIDITATSDLGEFGEIETNTPDIDPSDGLIDLSTNVVDGADLIGNNFCAQMEKDSEYIVTGTGGLPSNPTEFLNNSDIEVNLIPIREDLIVPERINSRALDETKTQENKIKPALGWVKNEKGQVVLVNYVPSIDSPPRSHQSNTTCQPH